MNKYINEYLKYSELKGKSPLTIKNYRVRLLAFSEFANCTPQEITLDKIDRFQEQLAVNGLSLLTQSYYLICIRSFLKYLSIREQLKVVDPLRIELPKIHKKIIDALSEDEVKRLLSSAPLTSQRDIRARAIIEFLLGSGVRVQELCNLKVNQIDLKELWFRVLGKGNKERVCFMNEEMARSLKKYLGIRKNKSSYLFTSHDKRTYEDQPITPRSIERLVKEYAKRAGIEKQCTPHTLRRSFAVRLLRKNVDIRYIQEFLGHESLQTTSLYTKIERNDLERIYRFANKKVVKDIKKDSEQIVISKESFQKLTGMVGKTMQRQNEIMEKLDEDKNEKDFERISEPVRVVN